MNIDLFIADVECQFCHSHDVFCDPNSEIITTGSGAYLVQCRVCGSRGHASKACPTSSIHYCHWRDVYGLKPDESKIAREMLAQLGFKDGDGVPRDVMRSVLEVVTKGKRT